MTPARLILLLLLILVAVVVVLVVLRRGSAQRDAQRVEAAGLRADADTMATTVAGQSAFADQAAQRAELARVEAEDKASEAARLEAEAAEHRAAAEASRRDYEATLRRADDLDPDVKESAYPAAPDTVEPAPAVSGSTDAAPAPAAAGNAAASGTAAAAATAGAEGDELPMTRAERREAREAEAGSVAGSGAVAGSDADAPSGADADAPSGADADAPTGAAADAPSVAGAATVGSVAAGTTAWTARDDESNPQSERIASAADFRDDVTPDRDDSVEASPESAEVYAADATGTGSDMSNDAQTDTAEHTPREDGPEAGQAAAAAAAGAGGAYAATRALHEERSDDTTDAGHETTDANASADADTAGVGDASGDADSAGDADATDAAAGDESRTERSDDLSRDAESPRGEWGGPPPTEPAEMTVVDPEAYAATEPLMASEQSAPVQPEAVATDDEGTADRVDESTSDLAAEHETTEEPAPAERESDTDSESGAVVAQTDTTDDTVAGEAPESTEERFDPTPTRDWAADEGELLAQTHDRGEQLEAERADLARESGEATASSETEDATASDTDSDATASDETASAPTQGRRISGFDELRDGGFGVGSAAPLDDGAQPLDHPVAAYRDTMTYRVPGDTGYDSAQPHVWFYDEGAAERSGFRRSEG